jgi:GNAT superfamily N-acetyltransferase
MQHKITKYFKPLQLGDENNLSHLCNVDYVSSHPRFLGRRNYDRMTPKLGFYFCALNNFQDYQVFTAKGCYILRGKKVIIAKGTLVAHAKVDEESALEDISVDDKFRRKGIGKALIRFINKLDSQFFVYGGTYCNSRYRLTEEGAALIQACEQSKILKHDQIIEFTVPSSPYSTRP